MTFENKKKQKFDDELLNTLQSVIKKHYADRDREYDNKDKAISDLTKEVNKKSDLLH